MAQIRPKQILLDNIGDLITANAAAGGEVLPLGAVNRVLTSDLGGTNKPIWAYVTNLRDTGGNLALEVLGGGTNHLTLTSGGPGTNPTFNAIGSDTDIDIVINPKGDGEVLVPVTYTAVSPNALITKSYADSVATGLDVKNSVYVATTTSLELTGYTYVPGNEPTGNVWTGVTSDPVFDGVTVPDGERVLIKDATDPRGNGIFVYDDAQDAFIRADDANASTGPGQVSGGMFTFVEAGGTQADTGWVASSPDGPATLGTTQILMTQFSAAGIISVSEGNGINVSQFGNTYTVTADADEVTITNTGGGTNVRLSVRSTATSGQVLRSTGVDGDDAVWGALDLDNVNAVTGTLGVTNGGTNLSTVPQGAVLVSQAPNVITALDGGAGAPTSNQVLVYNYVTDQLEWQTASSINATAYGQINGTTGSATATNASDQINIIGGPGISTVAANGSPDTLTINFDFTTLPNGSSGQLDGTEEIIINDGGTTYAVTINELITANVNAYTTIGGDTGTATAVTATDTLNILGLGGIVTTAAEGAPDTLTVDLDIASLPVSSSALIDGTEQLIINDGGTNYAISITELTANTVDRYNAITDGITTENAALAGSTITFADGAGVALSVSNPDTVTADIDFTLLTFTSIVNGTDEIIIDQGAGPVRTTVSELIDDVVDNNLSRYNAITDGTNTENAALTGDTITFADGAGVAMVVSNPDTVTANIDFTLLTSVSVINSGDEIIIDQGAGPVVTTVGELLNDIQANGYTVLLGDNSTTAGPASENDTLQFTGVGGITVEVADGTPDTVTVELDFTTLPNGSAGQLDGTEEIIINDGGTNYAITINELISANVNAYTTITGDSGSASATTATETLSIVGTGGIDVTVTPGVTDAVTVDLDFTTLPNGSAGQLDGTEEVIVNDGGVNYAITINELLESANVGAVGEDEAVAVGGVNESFVGFFTNTPITDAAITVFFNGLALRSTGWTRSGTTLTLVDSVNSYSTEAGDVISSRYEF
ncbi:MAG: hypothetical protein HC836_23220 [Richelia sp. RM2_1_2]|nr:hypothetical protein [Richelia sp. RM2_1_2]